MDGVSRCEYCALLIIVNSIIQTVLFPALAMLLSFWCYLLRRPSSLDSLSARSSIRPGMRSSANGRLRGR